MRYFAMSLGLLAACDEPLPPVEAAEPGPMFKVYCDDDCVDVSVVAGYSVSQSGSGRVVVVQGTSPLISYDIDGSSTSFGGFAASIWETVDCHDVRVSTYGLASGVTADTGGTGILTVSVGGSAIAQIDTGMAELHQGPTIEE